MELGASLPQTGSCEWDLTIMLASKVEEQPISRQSLSLSSTRMWVFTSNTRWQSALPGALKTWGGEGGGCYWHLIEEARDASKHTSAHRTAARYTENCLSKMSIVLWLKNYETETETWGWRDKIYEMYLFFSISYRTTKKGREMLWILRMNFVSIAYNLKNMKGVLNNRVSTVYAFLR